MIIVVNTTGKEFARMSEVINLLERLGRARSQPDIFDRTQYLAAEMREVLATMTTLSRATTEAYARRDAAAIYETNKLMRSHAHQLVVMAACIDLNFEAEQKSERGR